MKNTPTQCAGTFAYIAWWRRSRVFLKATKRRHRASTCSDIINMPTFDFGDIISSSNHWKRAWVDLIAIGVWHINMMRST
jgi:hypothetical protein